MLGAFSRTFSICGYSTGAFGGVRPAATSSINLYRGRLRVYKISIIMMFYVIKSIDYAIIMMRNIRKRSHFTGHRFKRKHPNLLIRPPLLAFDAGHRDAFDAVEFGRDFAQRDEDILAVVAFEPGRHLVGAECD